MLANAFMQQMNDEMIDGLIWPAIDSSAGGLLRSIRHGDAAKNFVESAFFGMQFFDSPALRSLGNAAGQSTVVLREDSSGYTSGFFLYDGGAFYGGQLGQFLAQRRGSDA